MLKFGVWGHKNILMDRVSYPPPPADVPEFVIISPSIGNVLFFPGSFNLLPYEHSKLMMVGTNDYGGKFDGLVYCLVAETYEIDRDQIGHGKTLAIVDSKRCKHAGSSRLKVIQAAVAATDESWGRGGSRLFGSVTS